MDNSLHEALIRIVESSTTRDELDHRIMQSYGSGLLGSAHEIAIQLKGQDWVEGTALRKAPSSSVENGSFNLKKEPLREFLRRQPSLIVLLGSVVLLNLVVLFPPYVIFLPDGLSTNAGFSFLFSPPTFGKITATVNVSLLALELLVTLVASATLFVIVRSVERSGWRL